MGASCVNAVSSDFLAEVRKDGCRYTIEFRKGVLYQDMKTEPIQSKQHGTTITFTLDPDIWKEPIDYVKLRARIKQIAYLNPGLTLLYRDNDTSETFHFPDGIHTYLDNLAAKDRLCDPIVLHQEENGIAVDLGFVYTSGYSQDYYTFVNNVETTRAGDHLTGFKAGIVKSIQTYVKDNQLKGCDDLTSEDCLEGMTAVISVKVKDPKFEGQGKTAVRMPELRAAVSDITRDAFYVYLSKNPKTAKIILAKLQQAAKARLAARKARQAVREQKSRLQSISLPGKLTACSSRNPEECELFLVEGESPSLKAMNCWKAKANQQRSQRKLTPHIRYEKDKDRYVACLASGKQYAYSIKRYTNIYAKKLAELSLRYDCKYQDYFEINETTGIFYVVTKAYGLKKVLVDSEDVPDLCRLKISVYKDNHAHTFYASTKLGKLHRVLMNPPPSMVIDHINRDGLDNRKENLRIVTISINNRNCNKRIDNVSGYRGIFVDNKNYTVYWYDTKKKKQSKRFSKAKYGKEAFVLAIEFRNKMWKENNYL